MSIPTEAEIRAAATELGLADANGDYNQRDRNRIAAAIQHARQEAAEAAEQHAGTTAQALAQFAHELHTAGPFTPDATSAVLAEVARWLLDTRGLQLEDRKETTPS